MFLISFCKLVENITCEYLLVIHSKKSASSSGKDENFLPYFFGFRALGSIIGNYFGGRFLEDHGIEYCHEVCSYLSLSLLIFTYFYQEKMIVLEETKNKTFFQEFNVISQLLFRDKVFQMIVIVCLINFTPSYDAVITSYLTDNLHMNKRDLANLHTVGSVFYVLALVVYQTYFKNYNP